MKKYAIVHITGSNKGSVITQYLAEEPAQISGVLGDLSLVAHLEIPLNNEAIWYDIEFSQEDVPSATLNQTKKDSYDDVKENDAWGEIRQKRNLKLTSTDWTQLSDSPLSAEQKQLWVTYRQSLRDLPESIENPITWLASPSWPTQPE